MKNLNEEQQKAVSHGKGPMLVLAGPGSGKTTVITCRIQYLIEHWNVPERNILVITFTKAAVGEMRNRFSCMVNRETEVRFGTFHSVFFQILQDAHLYRKNHLITEVERYQIIRDQIVKHQMHYDGQEEFARTVLSEIGLVKGEMMDFYTYSSKTMKKTDFLVIYEEYSKELKKRNKIDFDDMLLLCYELLNSRSDILEKCRKQYQYILIDEFQDINKIQYEVIKLLAGAHNNLFVVGDDDQSVYSFRGAKPEIMLGFTNDFPGTEIITLNTNYRCSGEIVKASKSLIQNNQNRYAKEMVSIHRETEKNIHIVFVRSLKEEYQDICSRIQSFRHAHIPYEKMVILFRTNLEAGSLSRMLMEYNIPFQMRGLIPNLFHHFVVKHVMDYMQISMGDRSRSRFLRIINKPDRGIPREIFIEEQVDFNIVQEKLSERSENVQAFNILKYDLDRLSKLSPYAAINYIRKAIGYDRYVIEHAICRNVDPQEYMDILDELMDTAKGFSSYHQWLQYIERCEKEILNVHNREKESVKDNDAVTLATMHSAKGLEFEHVFILNAVEGKTPHKKAFKEGNVEEERRMFYVAVTRARYGLYVYVPQSIYKKKTQISRFVMEMKLPETINRFPA